MVEVAAVIVNWNLAKLTARATDSLRDALGRCLDEIVIVDNGSVDGSADELARRYADEARIRVVALPENVGFGAGANAGIRATRAPFVALLNNDAVAGPGFLDAMLAAATGPGDERVGAVTARILLEGRWRAVRSDEPDEFVPDALVAADGTRWVRDDDGVELLNSTGNVVDRDGNGMDRDWLAPASSTAAPDVFGFCGGAALLRRAALTETGLFDPSFFMYYEDTDLSYRLRANGWTIRYAADAVVSHRHAASTGATSPAFIRWNARNRLLVALRHAPPTTVLRAVLRTGARTVVSLFEGADGRARSVALCAALAESVARARRERRTRRRSLRLH